MVRRVKAPRPIYYLPLLYFASISVFLIVSFKSPQPSVACLSYLVYSGITWSNGDSWKEIRRFALLNLRDFGMGKKACEDKIIEECQHLIEVFKKFKGKL